MTKNILLECLKDFTREEIKDLLLPVEMQEEDTEQPAPRAAGVFLMRLPDSRSYERDAPYILHQVITGKDIYSAGQPVPVSTAIIRSIFCVYDEDEQQGSLALLGLMERVRIALLRQQVIGKQFRLDLEAGLEALIYTENTAPFYAGEMISSWKMPTVEREVSLW